MWSASCVFCKMVFFSCIRELKASRVYSVGGLNSPKAWSQRSRRSCTTAMRARRCPNRTSIALFFMGLEKSTFGSGSGSSGVVFGTAAGSSLLRLAVGVDSRGLVWWLECDAVRFARVGLRLMMETLEQRQEALVSGGCLPWQAPMRSHSGFHAVS